MTCKKKKVPFHLAVSFQILEGCSHVLPCPAATVPSFLPKQDKLISSLLSTCFPPFSSSLSWLLGLSGKVSSPVVSPTVHVSCLPCSWRSFWLFYVLLICFLRVAKVSNTKQCLWRFLAVCRRTVYTLAVQRDAIYSWGH